MTARMQSWASFVLDGPALGDHQIARLMEEGTAGLIPRTDVSGSRAPSGEVSDAVREVDRCLRLVTRAERRLLMYHYLWGRGSVERKAGLLRWHPSDYRRRLHDAQRSLLAWMAQ